MKATPRRFTSAEICPDSWTLLYFRVCRSLLRLFKRKNASGCPTCFIVFTFTLSFPAPQRRFPFRRAKCLKWIELFVWVVVLLAEAGERKPYFFSSPQAAAKNSIVSLDLTVAQQSFVRRQNSSRWTPTCIFTFPSCVPVLLLLPLSLLRRYSCCQYSSTRYPHLCFHHLTHLQRLLSSVWFVFKSLSGHLFCFPDPAVMFACSLCCYEQQIKLEPLRFLPAVSPYLGPPLLQSGW